MPDITKTSVRIGPWTSAVALTIIRLRANTFSRTRPAQSTISPTKKSTRCELFVSRIDTAYTDMEQLVEFFISQLRSGSCVNANTDLAVVEIQAAESAKKYQRMTLTVSILEHIYRYLL